MSQMNPIYAPSVNTFPYICGVNC